MGKERNVCPACGHIAYYFENGDRDCEGQQLEPDYSYCNYCGFGWQQYQGIWDDDVAYIYRKKLKQKEINWQNIFYSIDLESEAKRRHFKFKCSWCDEYTNDEKHKCDKYSSGYLLKLN